MSRKIGETWGTRILWDSILGDLILLDSSLQEAFDEAFPEDA
jgi:hypothetical protein